MSTLGNMLHQLSPRVVIRVTKLFHFQLTAKMLRRKLKENVDLTLGLF